MKPPMPSLSGSLQSRILGHLGDLGVLPLLLNPLKEKDGAIGYQMYRRSKQWYEETKSNTFRIKMAGSTVIFTKDPLVYKEVLGPSQKNFKNSNNIKATSEHFLPQGMLALEGEQWARVRKVATRALAMQKLDSLPVHVGETIEKMMQQLRGNSSTVVMNPSEILPRATLDIFHKIMYKWDPDTVSKNPQSTELLHNAHICATAMGNRMLLPLKWLWQLPVPHNNAVDNARDALRANTIAFIDMRTEQLKDVDFDTIDPSLLDCMMVAAAEGQLTKDELVDQIQTFFFAAYDSTWHTISLLFNHLAQYPHVQEKLRAELQAVFPEGKESIKSLDDLDKCNYLTWVFNETMRLVPHAPAVAVAVGRTCLEPCVINGISFDKGDEIVIDTNGASRDPANYPNQMDLDQFRPERFGEINVNKSVAMPFGFGRRICPGRKIASGELKAFAAYSVLGWKLSRPANLPFVVDSPAGLRMRQGFDTLIWEPIEKK